MTSCQKLLSQFSFLHSFPDSQYLRLKELNGSLDVELCGVLIVSVLPAAAPNLNISGALHCRHTADCYSAGQGIVPEESVVWFLDSTTTGE